MRFAGLKLLAADRAELERIQRGQEPQKFRTWRRVRVLLMLDEGHSVRRTAIAVGGHPREISRVGKRYLEGGLARAMSNGPRSKSKRNVESAHAAAVMAAGHEAGHEAAPAGER
jgi:hypothetical protein